jgi:hypothetical protein
MSERRYFNPIPFMYSITVIDCWINPDGTRGFKNGIMAPPISEVEATERVQCYADQLREKVALAEKWLAATQEKEGTR